MADAETVNVEMGDAEAADDETMNSETGDAEAADDETAGAPAAWRTAWRRASPEEKAASQNFIRIFRGTTSASVLDQAVTDREHIMHEGGFAYDHWGRQDAAHAELVGTDGWSVVGLGGALRLLGENGLAGVETVCSMGCGPLAVVCEDVKTLRVFGALSLARSSQFTAVDIIPWSPGHIAAAGPLVDVHHVRPTLSPPAYAPHAHLRL